MKIAITSWQGRVSPVFDVADNLLVARVEDGAVREQVLVRLSSGSVLARADQVAGLGIELLICGVISRPLEYALCNAGVKVAPQRCGEVEEVLRAFAAGDFCQDSFLMPGSGNRSHRQQGLGGNPPP